MNEKIYYSAEEIAKMLGVKIDKSYKIFREMNKDLKSKVIPYFGKTPINEITVPMIRKWQGGGIEKG